jgi:protein gp37
MAENSKIEWTDHTWNPWIGCTNVSPACDHCYAEALMANRYKRVEWGAGNDRVRTAAGTWAQPLRWDRLAAAAGKPAFVFCLSLGDIWDNEVDPIWRRDAFAVMEHTPHLIYLLLSKRIGNARKMCNPLAGHVRLPPNAALGATVIDQDEWDRDVWKLLDAADVLGARFTFCSVEPMLGPIKARRSEMPNWVIVGGESGPHKRPMDLAWARSLRDQCQAAAVPFFGKQLDKVTPLPPDLMVRQWPVARQMQTAEIANAG